MAATIEDLERWFKAGLKEKATHLIVVCDTYDWDDFPVYVKEGENIHTAIADRQGKNMQKVMEVYNLKKSFGDQKVVSNRCWDLG